ncbi:MAG TPA: SprT family zinc-dependent metalloprotease [Phycisphaerae bacterium]|nr:SprT family zinc-dependent metalloprotease [Phycisphaerae bacterium]
MHDSSSQIVFVEQFGEHIPVSLEFKDRERLSISVHPDGSVTARAPLSRTLGEVLAHLNRRRAWIAKQRRHFMKYQPLPSGKRHVSGETHLYLGRQYRLRVSLGERAPVRLVGRYFEVQVPSSKQPQVIAAAMGQWYQSHAESIFEGRMQRCMKSALALRLQMDVKLRVRIMARRWGSCSKAGMITLNTDLVKAPIHCIDYVIMHELCHLRVHDHSPAFFRLLGRCMPDWRLRKERLDTFVVR